MQDTVPNAKFQFSRADWLHFVLARSTCGLLFLLMIELLPALVGKLGDVPAYFSGLLLTLSYMFFLPLSEWLILRRRLPTGSAAWYIWPGVNFIGACVAGLLALIVSRTLSNAFSNPMRALTFVEFAGLLGFTLVRASVAAAFPAYWIQNAVSVSSWPYFMSRVSAELVRVLASRLFLKATAFAWLTTIFADNNSTLNPKVAIAFSFLILACGAVLASVLEGGGLYLMAKRAAAPGPQREEP